MKAFRLLHEVIPKGDYITLKLSPGVWQWHFRDKETLEPLTLTNIIEILEKTQMAFEIPDEIKINKNAVIHYAQIR